jgi:hypothetical protein
VLNTESVIVVIPAPSRERGRIAITSRVRLCG